MAGTEVAKAYVQIVPSAKGISGKIKSALDPEAKSAGTSSGTSMGTSLVGALKGVVAAAGIGMAIKSSLDAGGAIQQSFGGLETLYGDASTAAKQYAQDAYKAGISANDYAEQAVSFGASLKAAFGGDTTKSVEAANTAIMDMADNAAKMGTPLESIQNAYQGFAKQNYTMLDNLKLGYGGTKSEMERLLARAKELTGVEYNIDNLGDVYEAIHVIQEDLGLTGVAADEAEKTFTGSFAAMKSAATNLMASLSVGEMDVGPQMNALVETASNFFFGNLVPMLANIAASLPEAIGTLITTAGPIIVEQASGIIASLTEFFSGDGASQMLEDGFELIMGLCDGIMENGPYVLEMGAETLTNFLTGIIDNLPFLVQGGLACVEEFGLGIINNLPSLMYTGYNIISTLLASILQALPSIISSGWSTVTTFTTAILQNLPSIMQTGFQLLSSLGQGILSNLPAIMSAGAQGIARFISAIVQNLPQILSTGIQLLGKLVAGVIQAIPQLASAARQAINSARQAFSGINWGSVGMDIVRGVANGVAGAASTLFNSLKSLASNALSAAKSALGIKSPSRVFAAEVGKFIPSGIALGIEQNSGILDKAIEDVTSFDFDGINGKIKGSYSINGVSGYNGTVIDLLRIIAEKETSVNIGNREFKRSLEDVGVAFA